MIIRHHKDRRLEWFVALGTFGLGLWLVRAGESMDSPAFDVLTYWMLEQSWAIIYLMSGTFHSIALGINGRAWWTPFVRTFMTSLNALVYAIFSAGFFMMDPLSTAVWVYSLLCVGALWCVYGATQDVAVVWRNWRDSK